MALKYFLKLYKQFLCRGLESAELLTPKYQKIAMLGLGSSVGTPEGGITAQVVVFSSFEDMAAHKDKVRTPVLKPCKS